MHPGRRHEAAKALFASMAAEGPAPDHTSYANIVRSYLNQAVGRHRQPQGSALSECVQGEGSMPMHGTCSQSACRFCSGLAGWQQRSPPLCVRPPRPNLPAAGAVQTLRPTDNITCCLSQNAAAMINQQLEEADLSADYAAVLEEEPLLKAALKAAEAAEAAQGGAAQPAAAQVAVGAQEAAAALAGSSISSSSSTIELVRWWGRGGRWHVDLSQSWHAGAAGACVSAYTPQ